MFGVLKIYKHFSLISLIIIFFLLGFLLIGSASTESAYSSIYLIKMKYNETSSAASMFSNSSTDSTSSLTVRANYLALCASSNGEMVCKANHNVSSLLSGSDSSSVTSMVAVAKALAQVCGPYLLITTLVLVVLMLFIVLWQMMPFVPGKFIVRKVCAGTALLASLIWGLGAMLQHQAIVGAQAFVEASTSEYIEVSRGSRAEALSWTSFAFLVVTFFAVLVRVLRDQSAERALRDKC